MRYDTAMCWPAMPDSFDLGSVTEVLILMYSHTIATRHTPNYK